MCGRFTLKTPVIDWLISLFPQHGDSLRTLAQELVAAHPGLGRPRFNIAPTQPVWVVLQAMEEREELPRVRPMRWGLVPAWADSLQVSYSMINARAETIHEKPSFKNLFRQHRCIVVADGYYEWMRPASQTTARAEHKQPYWIHRPGDLPFAMAGLWTENHRVQPKSPCFSTTVITTDANDDTRAVHDRMPAILHEPSAIQQWLSFDAPLDALDRWMAPAAEGVLKLHPVSERVNNPRHEGADLIDPLRSDGDERPE